MRPQRLIFKKTALPLQIIFTCFVRVSQQTPVIPLYNNNRLVCTMGTACADSEIGTECLCYSSKCNNISTQQCTQLHSKPPACFGFFGHHQGGFRQKNDIIFYQLDAQIFYFNTFITFLYMFRALLCSFSGRQIVLVQHLVSSLSLVDCSVHRLREKSPENEHNSARNMYRNVINVLK
jgi:hypothetical protein